MPSMSPRLRCAPSSSVRQRSRSRFRSRDAMASEAWGTKGKFRLQIKGEAERRQAHRPVMSAPHSQALPSEHASGAVARHAHKRCRLPALRARSPLGAPPRYLPRKLMPRLSPGRASRERRCGVLPSPSIRAHSDAPRAPVIVPAGRCPSRPGAGLQARPHEPHPLRQSAVTGDIPSMSEMTR